jgi:riboflavin biosynthesis pyrimidine reductase
MHHCKTLKPAKDDGGGELIASLLDAGQIDEFDIHVIPTFIGEAIPLMARRHRDVTLRPCL